jgi:serine/threonine-protein kinase
MSQLGQPPLPAQDFKVYMNLQQGLWMKYPPTWDMLEDPGASAFMAYFLSPLESPTDTFRENVNLVVEPLPASVNLEQVVANSRELLLQQMGVTFVEYAAKDQMGGLPAYRSVYTGAMQGRALKWLQYSAIKGSRAYTLTFTAEPARFEAFLAIVRQMLASLEIS